MQPRKQQVASLPTRLETPALFFHLLFPLSIPPYIQIQLSFHLCSLFCVQPLLSQGHQVPTDAVWEKFLTELAASRLPLYNKLS